MYYSFFNADFNCDINFPELYFGEFEKNTLFPFSTKDVKEVVIKKMEQRLYPHSSKCMLLRL